ncbi:starch-binding protein [Bacteroidia bacterium]|nr:starch-binding protein [Bacteroidia bacterium]
MKKYNYIISLVLVLLTGACSEYLQVVPDNTMKLENVFATKDDAWNALARIYHFLPKDDMTHTTMWEMGDDFIGRIDASVQNDVNQLRAERIMRGLQVTGDPILGNWSGSNGGYHYYQAIRTTNVFLQYILNTRNLTDVEREDWMAQAKFLKAYYHFLLLQKYGPIIISDKAITPDAVSDDLFLARSKVEDCFDYIINLIDEAIPKLKEQTSSIDMGMIDRGIATAIKARIMLFRASPFYSGNRDFFEDFLDPEDGKPYFPVFDTPERTKEKWNEALTAVNTAIQMAESYGKTLYTYEKPIYIKDEKYYSLNPEKLKTYYDVRMVVVDPWNKELIWGNSNVNVYDQGDLSSATNIRLPADVGISEGDFNAAPFSWQWLGTPYRTAERYYTENGLPITEDPLFNYNSRHDIVTTPGAEDPDYPAIAGLVQPNQPIVNLYLNREMRFYANLGITGGYFRSHFEIIPTYMMQGTSGGYNPSINGTDFFCTGIGIQKLVHPESRSSNWQRVIRFPFPIIRMADLYLMKAEILNEIKETPDAEVWNEINRVRARAGIPTVQASWANARTANKHTTKAGMRDIILQERGIEFAFEGSRYWDMLRHKRAHIEFSSPVQGWNYKGTNTSAFFVLGVVQSRRFTVRDYLWPISLNELNTNGKLIQNPGW